MKIHHEVHLERYFAIEALIVDHPFLEVANGKAISCDNYGLG